MKKRNSIINLDRIGNSDVRIETIHNHFPKLPIERVREDAVRLVFEGTLIPGDTPGTYHRKEQR